MTTASSPQYSSGSAYDALDRIWDIVHTPTKATSHRSADRHFMADFDAIRQIIKDARGVAYEDRHPSDMVLHPLSEIREWDEALAVLGIQDSDQTPADAIRERDAEIERLRCVAQGSQEPRLGDIVSVKEGTPYFQEWRGQRMQLVSLRIEPSGKLWASLADEKPRHRGCGIYDGETTEFEFDHLEKASSVPSTEGNSRG